MFELADESYAVENADPMLKQKATDIILSNNEDGVANTVKEVKRNPKKMQRDVKKQMQQIGIGTKSQQALKLQHEQNKQERKEKSREQKEARQLRLFELKQQKKKEKHKGH